jgi:Ca2+-binding EF-hand superfamily protein
MTGGGLGGAPTTATAQKRSKKPASLRGAKGSSKAKDDTQEETLEDGAVASTPLLGALVDTLDEAPTEDLPAVSQSVKGLGATVIADAVRDVSKEEAAQHKHDNKALQAAIKIDAPGLKPAERERLEQAESSIELERKQSASGHALTNDVLFTMRNERMKDVDKNGDGMLDSKELGKQIHKAWRGVQHLRTAELRAKEKPNLQEFIKGVNNYITQGRKGKKTVTEKDLTHLLGDGTLPNDVPVDDKLVNGNGERSKALFKYADGNHDGELDEDELFAFFNPSEVAEESDSERSRYLDFLAQDQFDAADADKNGKVSLTEYTKWQKSLWHSPTEDKHWSKRFKQLDKDRSGSLNVKEMKAAVMQKESKKFDGPVNDMLHIADTNKDGRVSLDEIKSHSKELASERDGLGRVADFFDDQHLLDKRLTQAQMSIKQRGGL